MNLLALELSTKRRSVAVLRVEGQELRMLAEVADENFRTVTSMSLIGQVLQSAGVLSAEIDRIALGMGPGSYTGIRSGIAIAQGWQIAREIPVAAIPSLDIVALEAQKLGLRGELEVIADAQRKEIYSQSFFVSEAEIEAVRPLTIKSPSDIEVANHMVIGPEATRFIPSARDVYPSASALAQLAFRQNQFTPGEKLVPIYLREAAFVKAPESRSF